MIKFIKSQIEKHPKLYEIFKFLLIGGFATLIDMAAMAVVIFAFKPALYGGNLLKVFIDSSQASVVAVVCGTAAGFLVSVIFNYILSVIFVFNKSDTGLAKSKRGFAIFVVLSAGGLLIHTVGIYIGYDLLNFNEWIIKITLTVVVLIYNFISRKKLLFSSEASGRVALDGSKALPYLSEASVSAPAENSDLQEKAKSA